MTCKDPVDGTNKFMWALGFALTLFIQCTAGVWWASAQSTKLQNIEDKLIDIKRQSYDGLNDLKKQVANINADLIVRADKMARIDERVAGLVAQNGEIKEHIATVETFLHTEGRGQRRHN
ncbi:MAG: hypothetical protein ACREBU_02630 [Nitrososphaera sp.]